MRESSPPTTARSDGRYEVIELLGAGAVGSVYRARDLASGMEVALKRLRPGCAFDEDEVLRFRQEYHTLAWLRHPRIVSVYDYGIDDQGPFYTMELLEGDDLRARAPVSSLEVCRLLYDVASALAFLHSRKLLHRDIATRNVRFSRDGSAKLIDFGCLGTMGSVREVAGTPPFVPPEAIFGMALDPRSDLFGLGALGYFMLTGRHAFDARTLDVLPTRWQTPPMPPTAIGAEIPEELSELILSLLAIDPLARPRSAGEVLTRLSSIVGLDTRPAEDVASAYVQSSVLVGRKRELSVLRARLDRAVERRRGGAIVLEALSGTGKTRLLAELAVHARLAGAAVIQAAPTFGHSGPYGLAKELIREVLRTLPALSRPLLEARRDVLSRAFPELVPSAGPPSDALADPREHKARIQSAFLDFLVDVSRRRALVVLIDDLHYGDEASVSMLASLAQLASSESLLVVCSCRSDHEASFSTTMRDWAHTLLLRELSDRHVRKLVRALFGRVRNSDRLAQWIYDQAGGLPLLCVELARELVDRRIVRYVDGMWMIPDALDGQDIRTPKLDLLDQRVKSLDPSARRLGKLLALYGGDFSIDLCLRLSNDGLASVLRAIDSLVVSEIVSGAPGRYRFRNEGIREAFLRNIDPETSQRLHLQIASTVLQTMQSPEKELAAGAHFLAGGDDRRAAPLLEEGGRLLHRAHAFADAVRPLESAMRIYQSQGRPFDDCLELAYDLVAAGYMCDPEILARYLDPTIEAAARWSGMTVLARLRERLPLQDSVVAAFGLYGIAYLCERDVSPPPVGDALRIYVLAILFGIAGAFATNDTRRIEELLRALEPLSGGYSKVGDLGYRFAKLLLDHQCGRLNTVDEDASDLLRRLQALPGLRGLARAFFEGGALAIAAFVHAAEGDGRCLKYVRGLRNVRLQVFEVQALQVLGYYHLSRGEAAAARRIQRKHEQLMLSLGGAWQTRGRRAASETVAFGQLGDVVGLQHAIADLARLVESESFAHLMPVLALGRGELAREQGAFDESLAHFRTAISGMPAERSIFREGALAGYAEALLASGRPERAIVVADDALDESERRLHRAALYRAGKVRALAELVVAGPRSAADILDPLLERAELVGNPATCGMLREARATIALAEGEANEYRIHLHAAEAHFRSTRNSVLLARLERLPRKSRPPSAAPGPGSVFPDAVQTARKRTRSR